jgi:hypothetical protein
MNTANSTNPVYDGIWFRPFVVRPALVVTPSTTGVTNAIPATVKVVEVAAVANDANDWITLPDLEDVPDGHEITILCNAGTNFELRTPATSGDKINTVDSDGTQEYLCTDTEVVKVVKVSNTDGWMAHGYTALGAVATAVIPD